MRRRILLDIGAGTGAVSVLALVVLVSTLLLARVLSIEQFGKISVLLLLFNLTSVFDAVRPVTIYFANYYASDRTSVYASILWLNSLIGLSLGTVIAVVAFSVPFQLFSRAELLCLAGVFVFFFPQSAYWGWADAHGLVRRTAIARAALMAAVYLGFLALALTGAEGFSYSLVLLIASASGLALFWNLCRSRGLIGKLEWPDRTLVARIGSEVGRYMQFNLASLVLATVDRVAISTQTGTRQLGLYSGHFEIATKPVALIRAIQNVLNPHLTKARRADRCISSMGTNDEDRLLLGVCGRLAGRIDPGVACPADARRPIRWEYRSFRLDRACAILRGSRLRMHTTP
jgi:O-antigen/teichoic acid export membrane protein